MNIDTVKKEFENWIVNYLDIDDKVKVILGGKEEILKEADNWNDSYQLISVVLEDYNKIDDWCQEINRTLYKKDVYLMAHEPDGDKDIDVYGWVFIQRLSEVCKYSNILQKQDYYEKLPADFLEYVESRRSYNEQEEDKEEGSWF